jgi:hypothetical protein
MCPVGGGLCEKIVLDLDLPPAQRGLVGRHLGYDPSQFGCALLCHSTMLVELDRLVCHQGNSTPTGGAMANSFGNAHNQVRIWVVAIDGTRSCIHGRRQCALAGGTRRA